MELTAAEAWARILDRAREQLPEQTYRTWFARTRPVALSQDLLVIEAGSEFATEWIEDKYGRLLGDISADVFGRRFTISFQHHAEARPPRPGAASESTPAPAGSEAPPTTGGDGQRASTSGPIVGSPLNERYVFERFVVGSNNQLAAAACRAVAEAPAKMYNPLFIYGGVGLGKTHLMHAIGHIVRSRAPEKRVAYVTSERFTNDLIGSIQDGRMPEFRRRYREIDLLLIDDVQFLGEKERTQEEFFHTFNSLYDAQRQIVVTSDRPPKEIPGLEERLVSRFEWGLVTDIRPPDLETRVAILRKKADDDDIVIHDDVLEFIARYCRSSVRELEGAIIKLLAYSSLTHREVTTDLAREALAGQLADAASMSQRSPEMIRQRVAEEFKVTVDGLTSKRRTKDLTVPRQVAMYLMRELLDLPLVEIGRQFGGRDHSTVIHSIQKVEQDMTERDAFRQKVERLRVEFADVPPPF
ncbi:MAG TPA: chromosomal replication initiator protein DnaA [Longimicrobiales bacterium]|nr:chromosomal replication initiator protein DnaA [Longimicrobiales bacterium]